MAFLYCRSVLNPHCPTKTLFAIRDLNFGVSITSWYTLKDTLDICFAITKVVALLISVLF